MNSFSEKLMVSAYLEYFWLNKIQVDHQKWLMWPMRRYLKPRMEETASDPHPS